MAESARLDELQRKYAENPRRYFAPLANEYRKAGELSTAVAICRDELARFPGHMSGHVVLGQALYESRRPTEAQAAFERALALDPENLIALRHLGDIARDRGDLREARTWYERVLEADPRNDDIAAQLSRLAPSYGRPTQAPAYVPHPTTPAPPAAPTPPRAVEPLLEPLEWTALDLGISAEPAAESSAADTADVATRDVEAAPPGGGLLDFEPSQLEPAPSGAEPSVPPVASERRVSESFSIISDEVSAIADDHGLLEPIELIDEGDSDRSAESRGGIVGGATAAAKPVPDAESPLVLDAPGAAAAVMWDELLPSLETDAEPSSASHGPEFDAGSHVLEPTPEPTIAPAAESGAERVDAAGPGGEPVAAVEADAPVPLPFALRDPAAAEAASVEPAPQEAAAAGAAEPERAAIAADAPWQISVERAEDVDLTRVEPAGPAAQPAMVVQPAAAPAPDDVERSVAEIAPAPEDVAVDEVVDEVADVYDFLVPFDASSPGADESRPAALERFDAGESVHVGQADLEDGATAEPPFSRDSSGSYDRVVGLDVPPAPAVPPVLAAAVPELDVEDAASPTPAGAFVTETMAQLLSQQGHLEQALDVYAQLEAHRPHDAALRARADAVRARLAPRAPELLPLDAPLYAPLDAPLDAPPLGAGVPTAGAFFASLAIDEPAPAEGRDAEPAVAPSVEAEPTLALDEPKADERPSSVDAPESTAPPAPRAGFFDAPAEPVDERAAARLAQAFGARGDESSSLVSAIFDAPVTASEAATIVPAPPSPEPPRATAAPAAPVAEHASYGLGEFSFERFFAGLEEDAPPAAPSGPDAAPPPGTPDATAPVQVAAPGDGWPVLAAPTTHGGDAHACDDRTSAPDPALPMQAGSDDEDLAQFNAWLKGLLEP